MAQVVGYYENDVTYTEGPFVIVNPLSNGWRIECELKGHHCPCLADVSIYPLMRKMGLDGKTFDKDLITRVCDELNQMVKTGEIILDGGLWIRKI